MNHWEFFRQLKSQSTWRLLFFSIITLNIYTGHYIKNQTKTINQHLDKKNQISAFYVYFVPIFLYLSVLFIISILVKEWHIKEGHISEQIQNWLAYFAFLFMLGWVMDTRKKIHKVLNVTKDQSTWLNFWWCLLFTVYYFNFKINKINELFAEQSEEIKEERTTNISDTNRTTHEELYINNKELNNDIVENKDQKKLISIIVLFIISFVIGWSVMNWGTSIYAKFTGPSSLVITQPEKVPTQIGPAQLESILGFWKAAYLANETIETDLNISLAEMEKLGMVDQANAVRRAIEKKYDSIAELRNRYVAVMTDLASAYKIQPSELETLFDNFASTQSVRSDPKGAVFLELSLDAIKQLPSDQSSYKNHFGQIFGISEEGVTTNIE